MTRSTIFASRGSRVRVSLAPLPSFRRSEAVSADLGLAARPVPAGAHSRDALVPLTVIPPRDTPPALNAPASADSHSADQSGQEEGGEDVQRRELVTLTGASLFGAVLAAGTPAAPSASIEALAALLTGCAPGTAAPAPHSLDLRGAQRGGRQDRARLPGVPVRRRDRRHALGAAARADRLHRARRRCAAPRLHPGRPRRTMSRRASCSNGGSDCDAHRRTIRSFIYELDVRNGIVYGTQTRLLSREARISGPGAGATSKI